ncbi:hypothetical protein CSCA_4797 [Clostridium scatologenes]|uniref:Uncharacterized protein n=1 Tax=Clostridium scatologenes TaxID=1548 RepID=A0A0E3MAB4_CLOSL|nr:hypothetical protein CSCA_4797 [Clostridium scatologenes]
MYNLKIPYQIRDGEFKKACRCIKESMMGSYDVDKKFLLQSINYMDKLYNETFYMDIKVNLYKCATKII